MAKHGSGHFLGLLVGSANINDRIAIGRLASTVEADMGETVKADFGDQGNNGDSAAASKANGIEWVVAKLA